MNKMTMSELEAIYGRAVLQIEAGQNMANEAKKAIIELMNEQQKEREKTVEKALKKEDVKN
jgi:hypothetical protein